MTSAIWMFKFLPSPAVGSPTFRHQGIFTFVRYGPITLWYESRRLQVASSPAALAGGIEFDVAATHGSTSGLICSRPRAAAAE